jgi:putative phage-type endonuclease
MTVIQAIHLEQGSDAWLQARLGKVTASRMSDMTARTKSGWGAGRKNYLAELVAERLTGAPAERYVNAAMAWGTDTEPQARAAYEFDRDVDVAEVGFVDHPHIPMTGASPDGLVGGDGMLEVKCPNTATHIDTLLTQKIPAKYIVQMQWQMCCAERQWCDFVSFDPRMPEDLRLFVRRIQRDDARIAELEDAVRDFLAEIEETIAALRDPASAGGSSAATHPVDTDVPASESKAAGLPFEKT